MKRVRRSQFLALVLIVSLAGCGKDAGPPPPGPAELALLTQALDGELNSAATHLRRSLAKANADKRIFADELQIPAGHDTIPVDWWIYRQGWLRLGGVDPTYGGYFVLTPKGEAFLAAPAQQWLASSFQGAPKVDCAGQKLSETCEVAAVAAVQPTAQAADMLKGLSFPPQALDAHLEQGPSGWRVADLGVKGDGEPADMAAAVIFGDRASIDRARSVWGAEMNKRMR